MTLQKRQSFFIPTGSEILLLTYQQRRTPDNPQVCLYKLKDPNLFIEEESFLLTHPSPELPFWRRRGLPKQYAPTSSCWSEPEPGLQPSSWSCSPTGPLSQSPSLNYHWYTSEYQVYIPNFNLSEFYIRIPTAFLYPYWMCNSQLKSTIYQIELLISTAQVLYLSPKPILSRSCLSLENSVIFPGVPDSFVLIPSECVHNSCRSFLYHLCWSDPLSCLAHSHASLGNCFSSL